jgi:predicted nuclease of predicted toxin-antitoxin system
MNILIDMNLSPRWALFLTKHGYNAQHWSLIGNPKAKDSDIMAYAEDHDFVVLSNDLDFSAILASIRSNKPSVIQLRAKRLTPEATGAQVVTALRTLSVELQQGFLLTVDANSWRVRCLPL